MLSDNYYSMSRAERRKALTRKSAPPPVKFVKDDVDRVLPYQKYGFVHFEDGAPVYEYTRYYRKGNYLRKLGRVAKPVALHTRVSDSKFDPLFARSYEYVGHTNNIHLLINVVLGFPEHIQMTKEHWDDLSEDDKFDLYLDSSIALVDLVMRLNKKLQDVNIIKLHAVNQKSKRSYDVILWKSMATHLRYHFKKHKIAFDYKAVKFIADHHPRAIYRKYFTHRDHAPYLPNFTPKECTIIETTRNRREVGLYNTSMNIDAVEYADYLTWFKKKVPLGRPLPNEQEIEFGLTTDDLKGSSRFLYRSRADIKKDLIQKYSNNPDIIEQIETYSDIDTNIHDIYFLANKYGVPIYNKREMISDVLQTKDPETIKTKKDLIKALDTPKLEKSLDAEDEEINLAVDPTPTKFEKEDMEEYKKDLAKQFKSLGEAVAHYGSFMLDELQDYFTGGGEVMFLASPRSTQEDLIQDFLDQR